MGRVEELNVDTLPRQLFGAEAVGAAIDVRGHKDMVPGLEQAGCGGDGGHTAPEDGAEGTPLKRCDHLFEAVAVRIGDPCVVELGDVVEAVPGERGGLPDRIDHGLVGAVRVLSDTDGLGGESHEDIVRHRQGRLERIKGNTPR